MVLIFFPFPFLNGSPATRLRCNFKAQKAQTVLCYLFFLFEETSSICVISDKDISLLKA